jgi:hypothetical protein
MKLIIMQYIYTHTHVIVYCSSGILEDCDNFVYVL